MEQGLAYWDQKWNLKELDKLVCRIFVPLCGKSHDLKWIYDQGHSVVGVEGVEEPIMAFFQEQNLIYKKVALAEGLTSYSVDDERLIIFHCDLFSIDPSVLGKFDAVWDRGSLVAIYPDGDRKTYAKLLKQLLAEKFVYLIDTVDYDQTKYSRHPRSVPVNEINSLFGDMCSIEILETIDLSVDHPHLPKMQWDVDRCYEIIVLLTPK